MIDLRSDTITQPSPGMRKAMAGAETGDDVYGEDPTVKRLEACAADLLGKPSALFLPSGTMCNLAAFLAQTRPGETIILSESSHPVHYENAGVAMVAGLLTRTIRDPFGKFTAEQVLEEVVQEDDPHLSRTTLVSVENTTNRGGGACWDYTEVESIAAICRSRNMRLHCDGARLFNACAVTNIEPRFFAQCCDSVSFCLSKGLGAPVGSILAADTDVIHRAVRFRKMLGGGMRQAGILAAAGLYALEHHIPDLREDHRRTRMFRQILESAGLEFALPAPTNIAYVKVQNVQRVLATLKERGVLALGAGPDRVRVVFHRDIDDEMCGTAAQLFIETLAPSA